MSTIITRNSATSGSTPSSLVQGELAINVTDGRLFYGSGSGNVVKEFTVSGSGGVTTPGGSNTQIQYNNNGFFGGVSNLTWNGTTLSATGSFSGSFTGSLLGTSSYAAQAVSASYALNGGVTQLLAGPNVTLSPTNGLGQVTVSATLSGSTIFNTATGSYGSFYDTTIQTNPVANIARSMSFNSTDITNGVSISGSTSPFNTYIKTTNAGVYDIQFSAQVEKTDSGTDEIVIWLRKNGIDLTDSATKLTLSGNSTKVVAAWNWFVSSAANDYYQIIWVSADTGMRLYAEPINDTPGIPSVILTVNRVDQFLSNTGSFSGSFIGEFTGSLLGTSSYATQALSSSYATTASYALNTSTPFRISTGSISASVNIGTDIFRITSGSSTFFNIDNQGSTTISSSASNIFLIKNQNNTPVLTVSQSGIIIMSTQSVELTSPAPNGGIYFTSGALYVGLD
jgi:hypothetical protein